MCYGEGGACTTVTTARWCPCCISATEPGAENGPEEIKRAFMTAYAMDAFNTFDKFTEQRLWQNETVDKFLLDLHRLTRLVGVPLPEHWMTCTFVSGLPQNIKPLLRASSKMEFMTLKQLLTQTRAIMTDNKDK